MSKCLIQLNSKDKKNLENLINNKKANKKANEKAKLKSKVILLKSSKKDIATIMAETKLSKRTIINYTNEYIKSDNKGYFLLKNNYNRSELCKYKKLISDEFKERPPLTYSEGTSRVEEITGIKRSQTQIRKFFDNNGIYTKRTVKTRNLWYRVRRKIELKFKAMPNAKN